MYIYGHLVDGTPFDTGLVTGKDLIKKIWTDDYAVPPQSMVLNTKTKDGKIVKVIIPFSDNQEAYAEID